ncbi:hypothetical protein RQP46_005065 [Phenoliferia psychrophenolica]
MSSAQPRTALLSSAVSFLRDPSTSSSPLAQRIAFLESKGLSPQEIELAMASASSSAPNTNNNGSGPAMGSYPRRGFGQGGSADEFDRDWRDWFIMAVVGGGVGWVAVKLAQKFLLPHLQPPNESDLEAAQKALEAKYDEAAELLKHLQTSTDSLTVSLDEQKAVVEADLVEVRKAVAEMREGEKRREEWAKGVGEQVDDVLKSLPGMLEKQASIQAQSLTDLQTELKSLKSLLIARRPATSPSTASLPPYGTAALPSTSTAETASPPRPAFSPRTPGIPAWQLKSSATSLATATPTPPAPAASPAPTTIGGGMYNAPPATTPAPVVAASEPAPVVEDTSASGILVEKEDAAPSAASNEPVKAEEAATPPEQVTA